MSTASTASARRARAAFPQIGDFAYGQIGGSADAAYVPEDDDPPDKEVEMFWVIVVFAFVAFVLGFVAYALVRPFTHFEHHHPQVSPWQPLD
jgi:hypothetical protein